MDTLEDALRSPVWWAGVIVGGFVMSLVAAYSKPAFDSVLGRFSDKLAERSERLKTARLERIERLRQSPHL